MRSEIGDKQVVELRALFGRLSKVNKSRLRNVILRSAQYRRYQSSAGRHRDSPSQHFQFHVRLQFSSQRDLTQPIAIRESSTTLMGSLQICDCDWSERCERDLSSRSESNWLEPRWFGPET